MLHAVPELLDALETRLLEGGDPAAILSGIRLSELVGWPEDAAGARSLKQRLAAIQTVIMGLQSPLRASLVALSGAPIYGRDGIRPDAPAFAPRLHGKA